MTTRYNDTASSWTTASNVVQTWDNQLAGAVAWANTPQLTHDSLQTNIGDPEDFVLSYDHAANVRLIADSQLGIDVVEFKKTIYSGFNRAFLESTGMTGSVNDHTGPNPSFDLLLVIRPGQHLDYCIFGLNGTANQDPYYDGAVSKTVSGKMRVRDAVGSAVLTGFSLTVDEWIAVLLSFDGDSDTLSGYINGELESASADVPGDGPVITNDLNMGQTYGYNDGGAAVRVALAELYFGKLSAAERSKLFARVQARYPSIFE